MYRRAFRLFFSCESDPVGRTCYDGSVGIMPTLVTVCGCCIVAVSRISNCDTPTVQSSQVVSRIYREMRLSMVHRGGVPSVTLFNFACVNISVSTNCLYFDLTVVSTVDPLDTSMLPVLNTVPNTLPTCSPSSQHRNL